MPRRPALFSLERLAIVLALACLATLAYKLAPRQPQRSIQTVEVLACDLNAQACAAELPGGGRVELSITPRPIPVVKPLQVNARLVGVRAEAIEIDFAGVSMDMGENRLRLVADGDGSFSGTAMLPVCVSGRMTWQATLTLQIAGSQRRIAARFRFAAPGETRRD